MKDKKVTGNVSHGFMIGKPCLTKLIAFCDKMTGFMNEEKTEDAVYFDLMVQYCLDRWTMVDEPLVVAVQNKVHLVTSNEQNSHRTQKAGNTLYCLY